MDGIEKVVAYIMSESDSECAEIAQNAAKERERIRARYSQIEQDEYWKCINAGSKETEQRHGQLSSLSAMEAKKQMLSTQREMVDEAFALAARKLRELPKKEYDKLLKKRSANPGCTAEDLVALYKDELSDKIVSVLFD